MSAGTKRRYTLEEYLALVRESDARLEFWDGEIFAMSGGTLAHERVMGNAYDLFRVHLRGSDCAVFGSNMQIKVPSAPPYRYADGSVVCGKVEVERFNGNDLLLNPVLIYEVLSQAPKHTIEATSSRTTSQSRVSRNICSSPNTARTSLIMQSEMTASGATGRLMRLTAASISQR